MLASLLGGSRAIHSPECDFDHIDVGTPVSIHPLHGYHALRGEHGCVHLPDVRHH